MIRGLVLGNTFWISSRRTIAQIADLIADQIAVKFNTYNVEVYVDSEDLLKRFHRAT